MVVTALEHVASSKYKVYLDEQFAFVLYKGELSRYKVRLDSEITEEVYEKIKKEVIIKRARKRVLYLLQQMSRTELQVRDKLKRNLYTEDVIEDAITYAKQFGYIDDSAYTMNYIHYHKERKSRRELYAVLQGKGIPREMLDICMEEACEMDDERKAIESYIRKKGYCMENLTDEKKQKLYGYLARKGFEHHVIRQVIQVYGAKA